jgi:phage FluMu protein Com
MEFIVYIYAGKYAGRELITFRCPRCGRIVFRHNSTRLIISNAYGVSLKELEPGDKDGEGLPAFSEHKCHSCKSLYKILYQ